MKAITINTELITFELSNIPIAVKKHLKVTGLEYATEEQLENYGITEVAKPEIQQSKEERIIELENEGVIVPYNDFEIHFSRDKAVQFLGATQLSEKLGAITIEWKITDGTFKEINLSDAYNISAIALQMFTKIHKNN